MLEPEKELFDEWLESIESPNTRNNYGPYFRRLLQTMQLSAEEMRTRLKANAGEAWREAKLKTREPVFTPKGREIALCAFRHFIRYVDVFPPNDKIPKAPKAKRTPYMKWEQALKICDAATPPYRWVFRLQLHCGWGIGEFLKFNAKAENWERAKQSVTHGEEYFRFEFPNRKRNEKPWYTLIPALVLKEIFEANDKFPLTTTRGKSLDLSNYHSSVVLLESAFKNAANRAALKLDPMPSPHEFRDTFKTHCTRSGVIPEVKEFSLGHKVDPLGYEKCIEDPDFVWGEIRKAYGPSPQELGRVAEENRELRERITKLEEERKRDHADLIASINKIETEMLMRQVSKKR